MKDLKCIITSFLIFICCTSSFSQKPVYRDMHYIVKQVDKLEKQHNATSIHITLQHSKNPIKAVSYLLLFVYQKVISEQIAAVCEFEPSCSNFCVNAIKSKSIITGFLLAADRLTRCNGQAQTEVEAFLIDHNSSKVKDAPQQYRLKD